MANRRAVDYRGLWISVVCFAVAGFAVLPASPYRSWVHSVLGVQSYGDTPKAYLVKQVATGASAGSAILLILLLAAFTWRRSWYWTFMSVFPAAMLLLKPFVYAIALLWGCLNLIDPTGASSLMRDNALEDRAFVIALCSAAGFGICVWIGSLSWFRSRPSGADRGAADAESNPAPAGASATLRAPAS